MSVLCSPTQAMKGITLRTYRISPLVYPPFLKRSLGHPNLFPPASSIACERDSNFQIKDFNVKSYLRKMYLFIQFYQLYIDAFFARCIHNRQDIYTSPYDACFIPETKHISIKFETGVCTPKLLVELNLTIHEAKIKIHEPPHQRINAQYMCTSYKINISFTSKTIYII